MGQAENGTKKMLSFQSIPTRPEIGNSRKIAKKFKKLKKHHHGRFSSQNVAGQAENERKKIIVPIHSNPTQNREFQKKSKKFKNVVMASF